ncbi:MAG: NAD(P)H-dependent flavin oxidoreductase [Candidatus Bathyarchaeaceae archaeon]
MIKTEICDLLGIKYPIIQAAMGPFDTSDLASAVSNAGGLGVVSHPAPSEVGLIFELLTPDKVQEFIEDVKRRMLAAIQKVNKNTNKPFGLNIRVAPEQPDAPHLVDMIIEEREKDPQLAKKLKIVITSAGDPTLPYLKKIRDAGMLHFHNVPTVYHAKKAEKAGLDGLVVTGYEAGGHVAYEPIHTIVLVPAVVEAVKIPVVAGGGICDGAGLVAALAFGAQGIYMGTRFIVTKECEFNQRVKEAIIEAKEKFPKVACTVVTQGFFGPLRHLKNEYSLKLQEVVAKGASPQELLEYEGRGTFLAKGPQGDVVNGAIWCGQAAIRINEILSAKELIEKIMREAEEIIGRLSTKVVA